MKYIVGSLGQMLGGDFKIRYTNCKCIEARSEEEAIRAYKSIVKLTNSFVIKCIGFLDKDNQLLIPNFHLRYGSGKLLHPTKSGVRNHLVSRLLDEPKKMTSFSLYSPAFIQAVSPEDALTIYNDLHQPSRYEAKVLGYLDENNTFIVPNILDYIN